MTSLSSAMGKNDRRGSGIANRTVRQLQPLRMEISITIVQKIRPL